MFENSDFYLPLKRDQIFSKPSDNRLYCSDQIMLEDTIEQSRYLDDLELALESDVFGIVQQKEFDTCCSFLNDFKKLSVDNKQRLMDTLILNFSYFTQQLESKLLAESGNSANKELRSVIKCYLFCIDWLIEAYLDSLKDTINMKGLRNKFNRGKRNKSPSVKSDSNLSEDTEIKVINKKEKSQAPAKKGGKKPNKVDKFELIVDKDIETLSQAILRLVKSKFNTLFPNQIIEDELTNLLIKVCLDLLYVQSKNKSLKNNSEIKKKNFDSLHIIIGKNSSNNSNNSGSSCLILKLTSKIVKLIYDEEQFIKNLADFIISTLNRSVTSLNTLGQKIIHEVLDTISKENNVDSQGLKNVTNFLIYLSEKVPKVIFSNLSSLVGFYDLDSYLVRNTLTEMLTNIIINILTNNTDELDQDTKANYYKTKTGFINMLFERIYDKSPFCRKNSLQSFLKLIENNCLEYEHYKRLIVEAYSRLEDEKSSVRKIALQLCNSLIKIYPSLFKQTHYLSLVEVEKIIDQTKNAACQLEEEISQIFNKYRKKDNNKDNKAKINKIHRIDEEDDDNEEDDIRINSTKKRDRSNSSGKNSDAKSNKFKSKRTKDAKAKVSNKMIIDDEDEDNSKVSAQNNKLKSKINNNNKLNEDEEILDKLSSEEKEKVAELEERFDNTSTILNLFTEYKEMVIIIDKIVDLAVLLLGSKNQSDILESIGLLVSLKKLNVQSANIGIRKMLLLIMKPEEKIVKEIVQSYREIYFSDQMPVNLQALLLIELTGSLSKSEMICLKQLLKTLFNEKEKDKKINMAIFKEIWIIFLRNPESEIRKLNITEQSDFAIKRKIFLKENRIALSILNIFAEIDTSILSNNNEILLKQLKNIINLKPIDWLLVNESLKATQKIYFYKTETSNECLVLISKILVSYYGTTDNNWYQAMQELINTIFSIMDSPEEFCKYILIKLAKPIFINNKKLQPNYASNINLNLDGEEEVQSDESVLTNEKLSQFIFLIGHIALNLYIYCEKLENGLKKKQDNVQSEKKNPNNTENEIDQIGGGKEAEIEYDAFVLQNTIEEDLLYNNLIGKFTPLVTNIARSVLTQDMINIHDSSKNVYKTAMLSTTKMMCISKKFCTDHLKLIFDIISADKIPTDIKCNVITALGDLINRFPNIMQSELDKIFKK